MKKSFIPLIISTVMIFSGCQKNQIHTSDFFSMDTVCSVKSDIESKETEDIINKLKERNQKLSSLFRHRQ